MLTLNSDYSTIQNAIKAVMCLQDAMQHLTELLKLKQRRLRGGKTYLDEVQLEEHLVVDFGEEIPR